MTDKQHTPIDDQRLEQQFAQLRARESAQAPLFPHADQLQRRQAIRAQPPIFDYLPQIAASLALVAVASIFLTNNPEPDPAEIYAEIMLTHQQLQTDHLLLVSDSLLPAMKEVPSFYDINLEFEPELYTN